MQPLSLTDLEELGRLEAVAGDADHDGFFTSDTPATDQLLEYGDNDAPGGLAQDTLGLGEQRHRILDRVLAARGAPPSRGAHRPSRVPAVGRVADRKRLRDAVRPHWRHLVAPFLDRGTDRGAAFRLRGMDPRRDVVDETDANEFLKRLGGLGQEGPRSD